MFEGILRLFYKNPYGSELPSERTAKLHIPTPEGRAWEMDMSHLYKNGKKSRFIVSEDHSVYSGKKYNENLPDAHFLGASTTECVFVPEGKRWPDLITGFNTYNHGMSGRNIMENYFNLEYLLDKKIIKTGDTIFIMHAINDFSKIIKPYKKSLNTHSFNVFSLGAYSFRKNFTADISKNLYTYALLREISHRIQTAQSSKRSKNQTKEQQSKASMFTTDIYQYNLLHAKLGKRDKQITEEEFNAFLPKFQKQLENRKHVLEKIKGLSQKEHLRIIFITQPNAYREDYSNNPELFENPVLGDKNLTRNQTHQLLNLLNKQVIDIANTADDNIEVIDVANQFDNLKDINNLFYDSIHYTETGSEQFAKIINQEYKTI